MEDTRRILIRPREFLSKIRSARIHEFALSLNLSCSVAYALLIYVYRNMTLNVQANDSGYYFLRGAVRVGDILHTGQVTAVSTEAVARQANPPWQLEGVAVYASVLAIMAILALLFGLFPRSSASCSLRAKTEGFAAFFALPLGYLAVSKLTWGWPSDAAVFSTVHPVFWESRGLAVFLAEIFCLGIATVFFRKRKIPTWLMGVGALIHYGFWIPTLWQQLWIFLPYSFLLPYLCSGMIWLLITARQVIPRGAVENPPRPGKAMWVAGAFALTVLIAIWLPWNNFNLAPARGNQSLVVKLSRGPCYGACPVYTVTFRGNGDVEYVGTENVKIKGQQLEQATPEEIQRIVEILDQAHFSSLEDRAFMWCFDTPGVAISVAFNGRVKRVASDAGCVGAKSGLQAGFVQAADELDRLMASDKWVKCDGRRCR